jgi:hypothetical protein
LEPPPSRNASAKPAIATAETIDTGRWKEGKSDSQAARRPPVSMPRREDETEEFARQFCSHTVHVRGFDRNSSVDPTGAFDDGRLRPRWR